MENKENMLRLMKAVDEMAVKQTVPTHIKKLFQEKSHAMLPSAIQADLNKVIENVYRYGSLASDEEMQYITEIIVTLQGFKRAFDVV